MKTLSKIASYPLTVVFYLFFGIELVVFEVVQRLMLNVSGYQAHKKSVDYFNWCIIRNLHVLGTRYTIDMPKDLPINKPVIIASNHQSMWDIPPLIWFLRRLHVKFISKIELGKGIPSISYNLRKGGSVLIDRKDSEQATQQIKDIAHYISENNRSVVIFSEGTRSRDGRPKPFKRKGLLTLIENAPDAYVLPVSMSNSWKLQRYGMFPMPLGTHFKIKVHSPLKISDFETEDLLNKIETTVVSEIKND